MVRQSSHLAAVPLEEPDSAAARAMAPPVHLVLPKEHAVLLVPLASASEAVPLGAVHHGPTHRNILRARDGRLSTMQVMRRWRQEAHTCGDSGPPLYLLCHMRLRCARDEVVARLLCRCVKEFTTELPLTDKAVEFLAWKEHGCKWTECVMAGVIPGDLKRLFAAVRATASQGPAKAKLFVEDMIQVGEDVYARRNHRLTQIMQPPMQDRRRAVSAFLRGDNPFCPPAGRVQQHPPWNPFDGLPDNLQATFQRAPLHALLVPRSYIAHEEAMSSFPYWMATVAQAFSQWIES